jgi:polyferredoxin
MLFALGDRARLDIRAQHQRNPAYVQLADGAVRNGFTVKLRNMQARPRAMEVRLEGLPGAVMWTQRGSRDTAGALVRTTVPADALAKLPIFVAAPSGGQERQDFSFTVRGADGESDSVEAVFERPGN